MTPTDVRAKQFPVTFRGYATDQVDAFLDEVEAELARLLEPDTAPEPSTIDEGSRPAVPTGGVGRHSAHAADGPEDAGDRPRRDSVDPDGDSAGRAVEILRLAERTANEYLDQAQAAAQEVRDKALAEVTLLRAQTDSEAVEILGRAREEAETILGDARTEAERLRSDIRYRQQHEAEALERRCREAQASLDRLAALERAARERLHALLTDQLHLLEQPTSGPATSPWARRADEAAAAHLPTPRYDGNGPV